MVIQYHVLDKVWIQRRKGRKNSEAFTNVIFSLLTKKKKCKKALKVCSKSCNFTVTRDHFTSKWICCLMRIKIRKFPCHRQCSTILTRFDLKLSFDRSMSEEEKDDQSLFFCCSPVDWRGGTEGRNAERDNVVFRTWHIVLAIGRPVHEGGFLSFKVDLRAGRKERNA